MPGDTNLRLAKQQVAALKGFYIHLRIFVIVICGLVAIDAAIGPGWWVQWPFLGWGVGVLAHASTVFWRAPETVRRWETKKIAEVKRRLDGNAPAGPSGPGS